ncbi:MAG TPA: polyamine aminopropyltransferase [Phycisphaerales bacterium]|nr:polyamine aminopropyltransferase [Phycisphaerales bacterium]
MVGILLVSVFLVATCGLVYELVAGALASYLLGDSVLQFSTIIGTYLFAMGIGSYGAKYVERGLLTAFIQVQILVGLLGGCSAALLFMVFSYGSGFRFVLYGLVFSIGFLVGLEIPLLLRILKEHIAFRDLVSQVLALDYVGALAASVLFPLFLVPHLGLIRTSFLFGMVNVAVAFIFVTRFQKEGRWSALSAESALVFLLLLAGFVFTDKITRFAEQGLYPAPVIVSRQTPYQKLAITREPGETRLYLNGNLQFSTFDEYRYHEALVVPALMAHSAPQKVLVLGGGDGLAVDLLLKDPRVEEILLVELDPVMIEIFRDHPEMHKLNNSALRSPKVKVVMADAFAWLEQNDQTFDLALVDFPDPSNYSVGKLYTSHFYRRLAEHLSPKGLFVVQCSSPLAARRSYWSIISTLEFSGLKVLPYHVYVPSFGEWGFALASKIEPRVQGEIPIPTRFLDQSEVERLSRFPADMSRVAAEANRLFDQILVRYFQEDWSRYRGRDGN